MKWSRWYVAEISYFVGNPINRAIVQCVKDTEPVLVDIVQGDGYERINPERLRHFKVICEIEEMRKNYA